jgi:hypothetical protein
MSEHQCLVCEQRPHEHALVCNSCRRHLRHLLADIRELWTRLPEALQPLHSGGQKVSGSRTPPVPVNLDSVDLSGLARPGSRGPYVRGILGLDEDQIGHLAAATTLDRIARDWRNQRHTDEHPPAPTVPELTSWLDNRLDHACDKDETIADTAGELRDLKSALRRTLNDYPPQPDLCEGIACKQCDLRALYRGEKWITCGNCGLLYSHDEYHEWVGLLAANAKKVAA